VKNLSLAAAVKNLSLAAAVTMHSNSRLPQSPLPILAAENWLVLPWFLLLLLLLLPHSDQVRHITRKSTCKIAEHSTLYVPPILPTICNEDSDRIL
jgi:hypothetical protein